MALMGKSRIIDVVHQYPRAAIHDQSLIDKPSVVVLMKTDLNPRQMGGLKQQTESWPLNNKGVEVETAHFPWSAPGDARAVTQWRGAVHTMILGIPCVGKSTLIYEAVPRLTCETEETTECGPARDQLSRLFATLDTPACRRCVCTSLHCLVGVQRVCCSFLLFCVLCTYLRM